MDGSLKLGSALSLLFVLYAVWYRRGPPEDPRLAPVLEGLLRLEREHSVDDGERRPRVALGYGACLDLFVNATALLDPADLTAEPRNYNDIATREELVSSFAYFFKHGAAAERFVSNASLYGALVAAARGLAGARWAVGGNAPLMAARFSAEGWRVLLGARLRPEWRAHLPADVALAGGAAGGAAGGGDDVHLILEYAAGAAFGALRAPRANRFIIHNDVDNPLLGSLEPLGAALPAFRPDLLVVSGLQMMDSHAAGGGGGGGDARAERLQRVRAQVLAQPPGTLTHFEMGSFVDRALLLQLAAAVLPAVDSLGCNEQELANLLSILDEGRVSVVSDSDPRVAVTLDGMRRVLRLARAAAAGAAGGRALSRIHVHTLAYQAVLTVEGSRWARSDAAAAKAALTAHRYVCNSTSVEAANTRLLLDESFATTAAGGEAGAAGGEAGAAGAGRVWLAAAAAACWAEGAGAERLRVCVAPVPVCAAAVRTAGAGDNVSAAGLVLQVRK